MSIFDKISERVGDFVDEVMLPESVRRAHDEASRLMRQEDWGGAVRILRPTLIDHPGVARTHHLIGLCHLELGEWSHGQDSFERALEIKETAASHYRAGLAAQRLEAWPEVQRHFARALGLGEKIPFELELRVGLGRAYMAGNRADKAVREFRAAVKLAPEELEVLGDLAEALLAKGDAASAAELLANVEARRSAALLVLSGRVEEALGRREQAMVAFAEGVVAAEGGPDDLLVSALLGATRNALSLGRLEQARDWLGMLPEGGEGAEAFFLRGRAAELSGDETSASAGYRAALESDSRRSDAHLGLGRLALRSDRMDEAASRFARVLRDPEHTRREEALWGLGTCHLTAGDPSGARRLFEEALELDGPLHADVLVGLGRVALALGDPAEGMVVLREALDHAYGETKDAAEAGLARALNELRPRWELPDRVRAPEDVDRVLAALVEYLGRDARLAEFSAAAQRLQATMTTPLSLAIVGEFNAGKSTIVNELVGEDVLPTGVLPTTAHTGILRFGPRSSATIAFRDGRREEKAFDEARMLMKTNADEIERLEFTYPHPFLRLVNYWDTPGFNAIEERHEKVAAQALATAEAILWVMDANQVLSQTEFERLEDVPDRAERLVVVLNKIDRLGDADARVAQVEHLTQYVSENLDDDVLGIFAISARDASSPDEGIRRQSAFAAFREFLDEAVIQRSGRIKTVEVRRQLGALVGQLQEFFDGVVGEYAAFGAEIDGVLEWLATVERRLPHENAVSEREIVTDWIERSIAQVEAEIASSLRPASAWTGRRALGEEDRTFVLEMLDDRFERVTRESWQRTVDRIAELERELAERVGHVTNRLIVGDGRAFQRRLDGFVDEVRVLGLLWEERIFGALRARARERLESAGEGMLDTVVAAQGDPAVWRGAIRRVLPATGEEFERSLEGWYDDFFAAARRLLVKLRRDLDLLELEARHRYDVEDLEELLARTGGDGPLKEGS